MAEATTDSTVELPPQPEAQPAPETTTVFRPGMGGWVARLLVGAGIIAFIFALPAIVPFEFQADLISTAAIFAVVGLSMNVLVGYLGQLSLGHQAFYGIGAFASGLITTNAGLPFVAGIAVAALTGAITALVLGSIALRVRGLYLAIVTLAYGILAQESIFKVGTLSAGVPADRPALFASPVAYAYLCLGALTLVYLFDVALLKSKAGRAIQAIRDDEKVASSFGINITSFKLLAFIVSGVIAGLAGGLFAHQLGQVDAAIFDLRLGLTFVLMAVVGGLGNRTGVVMGSILFAVLEPLLELLWHNVLQPLLLFLPFISSMPESVNPVLVPVIGAGLLVITLIQFPGGIGQQISPIQNWIRGGKFDIHAMKDSGGLKGGGMVGRP